MRTKIAMVLATALAVTLSAPAGVQAKGGVKAGILNCTVAGGTGFIFGSTKRMTCVYKSASTGKTEYYAGTIRRYGIDIGFTRGGTMIWSVIAPGPQVAPGSLAGDYGGVSADVAAGLGVGAKAMVGGSKKNIALQPFSFEGLTGFNLAAGVVSLTLVPMK